MRSFNVVIAATALVCSVAVFGCKSNGSSKVSKDKEALFNEQFPKFFAVAPENDYTDFQSGLKALEEPKKKIAQEWSDAKLEDISKQYVYLTKAYIKKCASDANDANKAKCETAYKLSGEEYTKAVTAFNTSFFAKVKAALPSAPAPATQA